MTIRPRTLERYLAQQIYGATGFVLLGFLALFAFFDLIGELGDLGKGEYDLRQVFTFVALNAPLRLVELNSLKLSPACSAGPELDTDNAPP